MTTEQLKKLAEYTVSHYGEDTDRCKLARALLIEMERVRVLRKHLNHLASYGTDALGLDNGREDKLEAL